MGDSMYSFVEKPVFSNDRGIFQKNEGHRSERKVRETKKVFKNTAWISAKWGKYPIPFFSFPRDNCHAL
jgi:hypothetical protein